MKKRSIVLAVCLTVFSVLLGACSKSNADQADKLVIYSNADEEPIQVMKDVLDQNGYKDKYTIQSLGTSELGGKLLAEGKSIEADLVTMSSFYLTSAQQKDKMFAPLNLKMKSLAKIPDYAAPFTVQEGVIFYNTESLKEHQLTPPTSLKDLAKPEYKDVLAIPDIKQSSTAWLLFQALIDNYGEPEARTILKDIYKNAGDHIESSGSGPIKKVRLGEVAIGFGLRHQAIKDKKEGLPINFVEPAEGTYSLTESLAVVDKGKKTNPEAAKALNLILEKGRKDLLKFYPSPLYEGEKADSLTAAKNEKQFPEELTAELLAKHQKLAE